MYVLPAAGLLAVGSSCMSSSKQAQSPAAQQIQQAQAKSEEAMNRAQEAQRNATDQEKRAADARQRLQQDQQKLVEDRQVAMQETQKAQQLQAQANKEAAQAHQLLSQQQTAATAGLSEEAQRARRGEHVVGGRVTQAGPNQISLQTPSGESMSFRVDPQSKVQIEGQSASPTDIQQGADARVSYQVSPNGVATVTTVQVQRAPKAGATKSSGAPSPQKSGGGY
jgi:hypothetical protein